MKSSADASIRLEKDKIYPSNIRTQGPDERVSPHFGTLFYGSACWYYFLDRLPDAESFEPYHSRKKRDHSYYRIYVKNYVIYYVVIPDGRNKKIMEVRRILHGLQDRTSYNEFHCL